MIPNAYLLMRCAKLGSGLAPTLDPLGVSLPNTAHGTL